MMGAVPVIVQQWCRTSTTPCIDHPRGDPHCLSASLCWSLALLDSLQATP